MTRKHWRLEVEWSDSQLIGGSWEPIRDLLKRRKSVRCYSVGFVLADDKRGVVLAASVNRRQRGGRHHHPGVAGREAEAAPMTRSYRVVAFTLLGIATLGMVWLFGQGAW